MWHAHCLLLVWAWYFRQATVSKWTLRLQRLDIAQLLKLQTMLKINIPFYHFHWYCWQKQIQCQTKVLQNFRIPAAIDITKLILGYHEIDFVHHNFKPQASIILWGAVKPLFQVVISQNITNSSRFCDIKKSNLWYLKIVIILYYEIDFVTKTNLWKKILMISFEFVISQNYCDFEIS